MADDLDYDIETPETIHRRFDLVTLDTDVADGVNVMSMPVAGLRNPITSHPTVGPLAILLDAAAGISNHFRRGADEWTVTSELALELSPDGIDVIAAHPDQPVVASARPLGPKGATALAVATLTSGDVVIGGGTVRSFYISSGRRVTRVEPESNAAGGRRTTVEQLMSIEVRQPDDGALILGQVVDPVLNNSLGIVNGGVASAALEMVASAAVNLNAGDAAQRTASVRVNFLRPYFAGQRSRYAGTALRIGKGTAVGDATAIGDDDKVALVARITAYR